MAGGGCRLTNAMQKLGSRLGGSFGNNFLRVDCPLNVTEVELGLPLTVVEGTLCFFGQIPGTFAGNFDVNGSFWCGEWGRKGWG